MNTSERGFTYIHVHGCDCNHPDISGGIAYARSIEAHRLLGSGRTGGEAVREATDLIPDGSCLGWVNRDEGWPRDHRDHHLLACYREALRLRGTGATAWLAVEAFRNARHSEPGWNGWNHVGCSCDGCVEDQRLCAVTTEAQQAEEASLDALTAALAAAPWGAQPDGSFVTRRSIGVASGRHTHSLHAPAKQGPLVEVDDGERWGSAPRLRVLRTREEARAIREEERGRASDAEKVYAVRLRAARVHLRHGEALPYHPGQEGGSVELPSGDRVSARGALRTAGLVREDVEGLLDAFYLADHGDGQGDRAWRLTLQGIVPAPATP